MFDKKFTLVARTIIILVAGCELSQIPQATPTSNVEPLQTATNTLAPSFTPSMTAGVTLTLPPQIPSTSAPTEVPGTPTDTPTQTYTPNPYATYVIQPGDTMYYILQQPPFYYPSDSWNTVINQILQLNPSLRDANHLPGAGSSIIVPL